MRDLFGHTIGYSFIQKLTKVSDLIEFEGPLLSHFIDDKKRNYLYYWVDSDHNYNRWAIWYVKESEFCQYLFGELSLHDLLLSDSKQFVIFSDIDSELNHHNTLTVDIDEIPLEYIPEVNSFFSFEDDLEIVYSNYSEKLASDFYLETLKRNSIYLKIESSDLKHGSTVSLHAINEFISSIFNSYKNFKGIDLEKYFFGYLTDKLKLEKILKLSNEETDLRGFYFAQGSFEIGLALDKTMIANLSKDKKITNWAKTVFDRFKKDVIEIDYSNESEIERIVSKYDEYQRAKIYKPLIDLSTKRDFKLSYFSKYNAKQVTLFIIDEEGANKIIPSQIKDKSDEIELINVLAVVKKGAKRFHISESNTLFSNREEETIYFIDNNDFEDLGLHIDRKLNFQIDVTIDNNNIILTTNFYGEELSITSEDPKKGKNEIIKLIYERLLIND